MGIAGRFFFVAILVSSRGPSPSIVALCLIASKPVRRLTILAHLRRFTIILNRERMLVVVSWESSKWILFFQPSSSTLDARLFDSERKKICKDSILECISQGISGFRVPVEGVKCNSCVDIIAKELSRITVTRNSRNRLAWSWSVKIYWKSKVLNNCKGRNNIASAQNIITSEHPKLDNGHSSTSAVIREVRFVLLIHILYCWNSLE